MKVAIVLRKRVSSKWWFRVVVQLSLILLGACSQRVSFRSFSKLPSPVKLNTKNPHEVVIGNGLVSLNLSKPEGDITGVYIGTDNINLLETKNRENDRGYLDVVWNEPGKPGMFQRIAGTNFSVIAANENIVEVSFKRTWTACMKGSSVPINIDKRYILRRGDYGFYSYAIFNRPSGFPAVEVDQIRIVFKLDETRFHYMAISDTRQRNMPSVEDRNSGKRLAYPEAVLLTHSTEEQFKGEVDDKYQYSTENKDNTVHGWITQDDAAPVGFWLITPSNEFRHAGPNKQDLTSHVGPVTLSMFVSTHYAGKEVSIAFGEGETYNKVFGPVFVYLNSVPNKSQFRSLWSDAVEQLSNEVRRWPYDFVGSRDFVPPSQRGTVAGQLLVQDGWGMRTQPGSNAYVGLALPGDAGSWQRESKGYQFWIQADIDGHFLIKNIVPGDYNLYAWVPGFIGDYKYATIITIEPGCNINLTSLVYYPPRNGPTLWEIGIPDRSGAEFYVPDPNPMFRNRLFTNDSQDKFRQYGLWERYTELYPDHDLVYTVGKSNYHTDWFYAQVTRSTLRNTFDPTTWQIQFQLKNITTPGNYTLQVALASATNAKLEVRFNEPNAMFPHFSTGLIGDSNAIARHGIHGLYRMYTIAVDSIHLVKGKNTIYLRQSKALNPFMGVMYDYVRLESPPIEI